MWLIVAIIYLSCKETILVPNLEFILTSFWIQHPHAVSFMRNKIQTHMLFRGCNVLNAHNLGK